MNNKNVEHLEPLSKSSHKKDHDRPTVDDWKIVDHTGQQIGTVYDLLYDREANKVRYIVTNLKNGKLLKEDRLVLMPVGRARLNKTENEVVIPNITKDQLSALPDYLTIDRLTQQDEYKVRNAFGGTAEKSSQTEDYDRKTFYDHDDYREEGFYDQTGVTQSGTVVDTVGTKGNDKNKVDSAKGTSGTDTGTAGIGGRETPSRGTGDLSGERKNLEDNDVNVHPDPATRSKDRLDQSSSGIGGNRDVTDDNNRGKDKTDVLNTERTSGSGAGKAGIAGTSATTRGTGDLSGGKNSGNENTKTDETGRQDSSTGNSGAGKAGIGGSLATGRSTDYSGQTKSVVGDSNRSDDTERGDNKSNVFNTKGNPEAGAGKAGIGSTGDTTRSTGNTSGGGSDKKDNDVNVHPDPATRSADRSDRTNPEKKDRDVTADRDRGTNDTKTGNDNKGSRKF